MEIQQYRILIVQNVYFDNLHQWEFDLIKRRYHLVRMKRSWNNLHDHIFISNNVNFAHTCTAISAIGAKLR